MSALRSRALRHRMVILMGRSSTKAIGERVVPIFLAADDLRVVSRWLADEIAAVSDAETVDPSLRIVAARMAFRTGSPFKPLKLKRGDASRFIAGGWDWLELEQMAREAAGLSPRLEALTLARVLCVIGNTLNPPRGVDPIRAQEELELVKRKHVRSNNDITSSKHLESEDSWRAAGRQLVKYPSGPREDDEEHDEPPPRRKFDRYEGPGKDAIYAASQRGKTMIDAIEFWTREKKPEN